MIETSHQMANRRVVVAGATGLVGTILLHELLTDASVAEVHAVCRRDLSIKHPKLVIHVVDFRAIPPLPPIDEIYLALGTTIKQAGSQEAFRAVDFDANLAVAQAGVTAGAQRIGLVSAMAANPRSSVFYNRVKGELEDALTKLSTKTLVIARPSFLLGDRDALNQPIRYGERIGIVLSRLLKHFIPADYRPVEARNVALALLSIVPVFKGKKVLLSGEIQRRQI